MKRDRLPNPVFMSFPGGSDSNEYRRPGFDLWVEMILWVETIPCRRAWQFSPVFLPGESPWTEEPVRLHSLWGCKE